MGYRNRHGGERAVELLGGQIRLILVYKSILFSYLGSSHLARPNKFDSLKQMTSCLVISWHRKSFVKRREGSEADSLAG